MLNCKIADRNKAKQYRDDVSPDWGIRESGVRSRESGVKKGHRGQKSQKGKNR